ncbi:MAG: matrixin family metalloprotease [Pirellulales bacterium]|nr:matrixin family metalloprotease [Pirellulales bacterium]
MLSLSPDRCILSSSCPVLAMAVVAIAASICEASVVVLANRTTAPVSFQAVIDNHRVQNVTLEPGDSRPLFAEGGVRIKASVGGRPQEIALDPDCAYFMGKKSGAGPLELVKIGLGETPGRAWQPLSPGAIELRDAGVIDVKVLVDDDEVRPRQVWERVVRERVAKASAALEAHCGVTLRITAVGEWDSDDLQRDFHQSMREFESEVLPAPAQIAIGFSSQYDIAKGRVHMGGTRGPLHSHIILKERSRNVLETERLELLVHELGHVLGASHSPEPNSVMRPVITGGLQRAAGARVQFDPPNTLLMALMGQEIRKRRIGEFEGVTPQTRRRMQEIYTAIAPTLPDDPAANQYLQLVASAGARPLVGDAQKILQQLARVATVQQKLNQQAGAASGNGAPVDGDKLLELYVRQAALAAKQVRRENGPQALVLALGVAFDDTGALRALPIASGVVPHIEGEGQRTERMAAFGKPTMRGRADLAKHFFVSAHLVALSGAAPARGAGLMKEILDSHGGSGFSFADMAANRAGIVFANAVLTGRLSLDDVAQRFTIDAFLPPVDDLQEQLGAKEFTESFGGVGDDRLTAELNRIEARIMALPVYQNAANAGP